MKITKKCESCNNENKEKGCAVCINGIHGNHIRRGVIVVDSVDAAIAAISSLVENQDSAPTLKDIEAVVYEEVKEFDNGALETATVREKVFRSVHGEILLNTDLDKVKGKNVRSLYKELAYITAKTMQELNDTKAELKSYKDNAAEVETQTDMLIMNFNIAMENNNQLVAQVDSLATDLQSTADTLEAVLEVNAALERKVALYEEMQQCDKHITSIRQELMVKQLEENEHVCKCEGGCK